MNTGGKAMDSRSLRERAYTTAGAIMEDEHYIPRDSDETLKNALLRMEYILLVEPRQQGKTSAINRLHRHAESHWAFIYHNLSAGASLDPRTWSRRLGGELWKVAGLRGIEMPEFPLEDLISWKDYLENLA